MTDNQKFIVNEMLPRIASVSVHQGFHITVTWEAGSRKGQSDVVDLGPTIMTYKLYAPLRDNADLFRTVRVINYGSALGWGDGDRIDMSAEGVEDLAEQAMTAVDFRLFMERHKFTQEAAAAQLGVSRRQVNYFLTSKAIPRTVALACAYLDIQLGEEAASTGDPVGSNPEGTASDQQFVVWRVEATNGDHANTWRRIVRSKRHVIPSGNIWNWNDVSVVDYDEATSEKANLAALVANKPAIIKPK